MVWKTRRTGTRRQRGTRFPSRSRRSTVFFKAKYAYLGSIVSLENPQAAKASANTLSEMFNKADTRAKKRRIKRATVLASIRARIMSQNKRLSSTERREMAEIHTIYSNAYHTMVLPKRG